VQQVSRTISELIQPGGHFLQFVPTIHTVVKVQTIQPPPTRLDGIAEANVVQSLVTRLRLLQTSGAEGEKAGLRPRQGIAYRRQLERLLTVYIAGEVSLDRVTVSVQGWANHVRFGDTWGLRRAVLGSIIL
jgi:hypothetical protein